MPAGSSCLNTTTLDYFSVQNVKTATDGGKTNHWNFCGYKQHAVIKNSLSGPYILRYCVELPRIVDSLSYHHRGGLLHHLSKINI